MGLKVIAPRQKSATPTRAGARTRSMRAASSGNESRRRAAKSRRGRLETNRFCGIWRAATSTPREGYDTLCCRTRTSEYCFFYCQGFRSLSRVWRLMHVQHVAGLRFIFDRSDPDNRAHGIVERRSLKPQGVTNDTLEGVTPAYLARNARVNACALATLAASGYDASLKWTAFRGAAGYRVFWREAWTPDWQYERNL